MENSPVAITRYCDLLRRQKRPGNRIGGIVLNANPFTLGHRFLVETRRLGLRLAPCVCRREDASVFSYADRFALVAAGVKDIEQAHAPSGLRLHHLARDLPRLFSEGEGNYRSKLGGNRLAPVSRVHRAGARHYASLCRDRAVRSGDQQLQRRHEVLAARRGIERQPHYRRRSTASLGQWHADFSVQSEKAPGAGRFRAIQTSGAEHHAGISGDAVSAAEPSGAGVERT